MNRSILLAAAIAVAMSLFAAPTRAYRATADTCAAKLPAESKLIYAETIGAVGPGIDLREMVTAKTRALVMSGKLSRSNARPAAEAAGACLRHAL